jgi:hypothetical protein
VLLDLVGLDVDPPVADVLVAPLGADDRALVARAGPQPRGEELLGEPV